MLTHLEEVTAPTASRRFPANFVWGAATAAYQVEGAISEDGRSPSIWDTYSATPGKVLEGHTGAVACDHYHLWRNDIALMQRLNIGGYRFSVAWPRVIPQGRGQINQAGLDFYDRLVDGLLEAGIKPYATLYHWDLPQILEDAGGWTNRETAYAFAEYADAVTRRLGDRVVGYITHNEPWCAAHLGYMIGRHAPGRQDKQAETSAVHHLLLSHGLAVPIIRQNAPKAEVGITLNLWPFHPATESEADRAAALVGDNLNNRLYLEPLYQGAYPEIYVSSLPDGVKLPIQPGDMEIIKTPTDFLGINYYHRQVIKADPPNLVGQNVSPPGVYTTMGWEVYPPGIYEMLQSLHGDYAIPKYYITENGSSGEDEVGADGQVHDNLRLYYYQEHLHQALRAIEDGIPLAGYFAWSLMDNFEWGWGYTRRFGIVHVDYTTQKRTIKDSGHWYAQLAGSNTLPDERISL